MARKKAKYMKAQEKAMQHSSKLGAGAEARKSLHGKEKIPVVMREFKNKTLHSGSGQIVTKRSQALAIAMHESGLGKKPKVTKSKKVISKRKK